MDKNPLLIEPWGREGPNPRSPIAVAEVAGRAPAWVNNKPRDRRNDSDAQSNNRLSAPSNAALPGVKTERRKNKGVETLPRLAAPLQPSWGGVAGREIVAAILGRGSRP